MKKVVTGLSLFALVSMSYLGASNEVFSIDSSRILHESKEGRAILSLNEKDKKGLMESEYQESKKIADLRDELENGLRAGKLTEDVIQDKYEELGRLQRNAKYSVDCAREDYKLKEQKRVVSFRNKVHEVAAELFKKSGGAMVFDKATPGIIYTSDASDRTDVLLKELNQRHEAEKATLMLTKDSNKSVKEQNKNA